MTITNLINNSAILEMIRTLGHELDPYDFEDDMIDDSYIEDTADVIAQTEEIAAEYAEYPEIVALAESIIAALRA